MKKLFAVLVMVMTVIAVNAQRTSVKVSDLQKPIKENIVKDYPGFTISEATKVVSNNVTNYEVVITKGTVHETLLYDMNGKFEKKVVAQGGTVAKPKPVEKPTTTAPAKK